MALVHFIIMLIVLGLWIVIGLFFWIPLLARMVVVSIVAVIASVFGNANLTGVHTGIRAAVGFYAYGFKRIFELFRDEEHDQIAQSPFVGTNWSRVIAETIYALLFWGSTLFFWYP